MAQPSICSSRSVNWAEEPLAAAVSLDSDMLRTIGVGGSSSEGDVVYDGEALMGSCVDEMLESGGGCRMRRMIRNEDGGGFMCADGGTSAMLRIVDE
jgi:hypothetical protein